MAYKRISRLREEKDLELYKLDQEDCFGRISEDDPETLRFFKVLKVKLRAQKDAQLNPDGAVLLPILGREEGPILQAQRVLAEWAGLMA
jgi:transcription-repair coupling factor (superfamily II helicase)